MEISINDVISMSERVSDDKYVSLMREAISWIDSENPFADLNPFIKCMYYYTILRAYSPSKYYVYIEDNGIIYLRSWLYNVRCGTQWNSIREYSEKNLTIDDTVHHIMERGYKLSATLDDMRALVIDAIASDDPVLLINNRLIAMGVSDTELKNVFSHVHGWIGSYIIRDVIRRIYREIPPGSSSILRPRMDIYFSSDIDVMCLV